MVVGVMVKLGRGSNLQEIDFHVFVRVKIYTSQDLEVV